jgi:hypothetical protein
MSLHRLSTVLTCSLFCLTAAPIPRHAVNLHGALTERSARAPKQIGDDFTAARMAAAGLPAAASAGLYLANEYKTDHNGVTHLVYRQRFQGLDIHGMEWHVNIDRDGQILNAGGQLFAAPTAPAANAAKLTEAARAALSAVNPILARQSTLQRSGMTARGDARFVSDEMGELTGHPVWFPVRGVLQPAWRFLVTDGDGVSTYDTVIDANANTLLAKRPLTMFQATAKGSVFTGVSPQPPVKFGVQSNEEPPYVQRVVVPFSGSPTASPKGWVSGTETAGNNTITGLNPAGTTFLANPLTARSPSLDFQFPLLLGPDSPVSTAFGDAVTTNLFYWTNRAHDLFYEAGFNEAAGNYQAQNFTNQGLGGDAIFAYSQFGTQASSGFANLGNAFYTTRDFGDGAPAMIAMFLTSFGGVWADGSLANDVVLHEYAHGVTFRLMPTLGGFQGDSINEGLSDFWALEFLVPEGASPDGVYPFAEYWYRTFGGGLRNRPYSTNMEVNPLTYADLGRSWLSPEIHEDGVIWVQALWEVRANLIRQFGEAEGRRRLKRIVIDGMKMSPPSPSMVELRDAILLAERVDYKGESQSQLWEGFAKRGLGVLAYSPGPDTIQVSASFDRPSNTGAIGVETETPIIGQPLRISVADANYTGETLTVDATSSTGDVETVVLSREDGPNYSGLLFTTGVGPARKNSGALSLIVGDAVTLYYNDANSGAGQKLIEKTMKASQNYTPVFYPTPPAFTFPNEVATGLRATAGAASLRAALPFDFPFYGKKYREVRILPEGILQFDTALRPGCVDREGFANYTGIAPMAMWMRTNGGAQPGENVYTSRGPNSFTIRWAGETVPPILNPPLTPAPEPVNFAATLYENGEIRFSYGAGNQNLVNSTPIAGCQGTQPVVAISRGIGSAPLLSSTGFERATFKDAPIMGFIPPSENSSIPKARIDSPAPDATVSGILPVRGIIYDEDTFVSAAFILIDGVYMGAATRGAARPDVCTTPTTLPGCPNIGFQANLNVAGLGLKPGPHTLQIRAANAKGGFQDYPDTPIPFTIEEGAGALPVAGFDTLKDGDIWKDFLALRGFAYSTASRITAVDVIIDGVANTRASYGLGRTDLCAAAGPAAGSPNCPAVGWQAFIDTVADEPAMPNGEHKVQLRITEDNGRISFQPENPVTVKVDNPARTFPIGVVTAPTNAQRVSGDITISGHAWDPDGRISQVVLFIDESNRGTIRYGTARPEVCATLKDVAACPNIGFDGTFDSRRLPNGPHRLMVAVVDNAGNVIFTPGNTNGGMNIIVNNP